TWSCGRLPSVLRIFSAFLLTTITRSGRCASAPPDFCSWSLLARVTGRVTDRSRLQPAGPLLFLLWRQDKGFQFFQRLTRVDCQFLHAWQRIPAAGVAEIE